MAVIKEVEAISLKIPYVRPFKISRGYVGAPGKPGDHVYVKITTSDGEVGWGEARPMPSWMYETPESVYTTVINHVAPIIIGRDPFMVNAILDDLDKALAPVVSSGQPFAKSSIDMALHDLIGKITGAPVHVLLGGKRRDYVEMSALISGDPEEIGVYAREMWDRGYRLFKLKIMGDPQNDIRLLEALIDAVPGGKVWLDANQGYSAFTLSVLLRELKKYDNILCLEQPVPTHDFDGLRRAVASSPVPVVVDESLFSHYDLLKLIRMDALDGLVLKVAKSGLRTSMKIFHLAEAAGVACLGSGMTESGVGLSASVHLFSAIDIIAPVDTNGPQFLSDLLVEGLEIAGARIKVPNNPGLGVDVREDRLEKYKVEVRI